MIHSERQDEEHYRLHQADAPIATPLVASNNEPISIDPQPKEPDKESNEGKEKGMIEEEDEESFDEEDYTYFCNCGDCNKHYKRCFITGKSVRGPTKKLKPRPVLDLSHIKPINMDIPLEIWLEIFSHAHPKTLAICRQLSKTHKDLLDTNQSVVKRARKKLPSNFHGSLFHWTPLFFRLTEFEVWNLCWGAGCMICGTGDVNGSEVRRPIWQYKIRCCTLCYRERTIYLAYQKSELIQKEWFRPEWTEYLVAGPLVNTIKNVWSSDPLSHSDPVYWLKDVETLRKRMKKSDPAFTKILTIVAREFQKISEKLDHFWARLEHKRLEGLADLAAQRKEAIIKQCSKLDPPIDEDVLEEISEYQAAIRIPRVLSKRSWGILLKKLNLRRVEAEGIAQQRIEELKAYDNYIQELHDTVDEAEPLLISWIEEFISNNGGWPKPRDPDPDIRASFILMALDHARDKWYQMEENQGKYLPFGLLLHLYDTILEERLGGGNLRLFKCGLCNESDSYEDGTLSEVFRNLKLRHRGDGLLAEIKTPFKHIQLEYYTFETHSTRIILDMGANAAWPSLENLPIQSRGAIYKPKNRTTVPKSEETQIIDLKSQMQTILLRTSALPSVPEPHRLFLWYYLFVKLYTQRCTSTLAGFEIMATIFSKKSQDPMFDTLKCGICGAPNYENVAAGRRIWRNRKFTSWYSLITHFNNIHGKEKEDEWTRKLLWQPTNEDLEAVEIDGPVGLEKIIWIQMLMEVDGRFVEGALGERKGKFWIKGAEVIRKCQEGDRSSMSAREKGKNIATRNFLQTTI